MKKQIISRAFYGCKFITSTITTHLTKRAGKGQFISFSSFKHALDLFIHFTFDIFAVGLAHCRHLKTVRTHLSGLVNQSIIAVDDPADASMGLTPELWREMSSSGVVSIL